MDAKILVVDDDLDTVRLIGMMLERRGFEIIAAQDGDQALAKIRTERPDLVLLDIMMPGIDGFEVCRRLRADPGASDLPVVMLTAKTQLYDKVAGFQAGADDYLTKPIHPDEFASRVETILLRASRRESPGEPPSRRAKVFGFLGSKGGVGTTTLAVNVAVSLAGGRAKGQKVILADLHSGAASTSLSMGLRYEGGLPRLLAKPAETIDARMIDAELQEHHSGVMVLAGQVEPEGVALDISPTHAHTVIQYLAAISDYLLLDLGVGLGDANRAVLPICDQVVVVIEPQRVALVLARALFDEMSVSISLAPHRIMPVQVTRTMSATNFTRTTVEGLLDRDLADVIPPAPELAFRAADEGVPMVLLQPTGLVAQQCQAIAQHLAEA